MKLFQLKAFLIKKRIHKISNDFQEQAKHQLFLVRINSIYNRF